MTGFTLLSGLLEGRTIDYGRRDESDVTGFTLLSSGLLEC